MKPIYTKFFAVFAMGWMTAAMCGISSASPEGASRNLLVEPATHIEPEELWHSRDVQIYRSADGLVVGFWPAAAESAPVKKGKTLLGFAMVGRGDVAEQPVVFKVWGSGMVFADEVTAGFVKRKSLVALFFLPEQCVSADKCPDEIAVLSMRGNENSSTVYVNNEPVGVIH